jgi:hypothetical protein
VKEPDSNVPQKSMGPPNAESKRSATAIVGLIAALVSLFGSLLNYGENTRLDKETVQLLKRVDQANTKIKTLEESIPRPTVVITNPANGDVTSETITIKGRIIPGTKYRFVFVAVRSQSADRPGWKIVAQDQADILGQWSQDVELAGFYATEQIRILAVLTDKPNDYIVGQQIMVFPDTTKGPAVESNTVTIRRQR